MFFLINAPTLMYSIITGIIILYFLYDNRGTLKMHVFHIKHHTYVHMHILDEKNKKQKTRKKNKVKNEKMH